MRYTDVSKNVQLCSLIGFIVVSLKLYFIFVNNMCKYYTISSYTADFEIQKKDSEESLLTFVNLFFHCCSSSR